MTLNLFPLNVSGYNNLVAALLARKEYLQAIDYSKKIVQEGLISYNTWYHLGIAYYRIDSIDKAVDYFKRATIPPNEQRAISMLGSCYKRKGEYNKAIKFLNEAIKLNENDIESWYEIGRCYFFIGDSNKAKEYLEHVVENNPNHSRALVALAEIYKDDNNEAIKYLEKAFILNPSDFAINYGLGFQYSEIHKFDSAITLLKTAASIDEQRYEPWLTLGSIYLKMGKYRESNKCLLKAVSLNDGDYLSWYFLGKSYYFLEDFGHAHNSQLKALSIKQDFHLSWIENGRVFLKERKYEDVIISMNIAIDYNPNYYEAYYLKGLADLSQMRGEEALKSFSIAATLISKVEVNKLCDIWVRIGDAYLIQGDYINSEEAYYKALKFKPEFIQPVLSLGIVKTMQKDKNEAFKYFDLAEEADPENITITLYRGIGYMNLSMFDDAETSFTQIVEHSGGKILGNVGLGLLSLSRGNTEEAVLFFDEASIVFDSKNEYLDYVQSITKYIEPHLLEKNWREKISNTLKID